MVEVISGVGVGVSMSVSASAGVSGGGACGMNSGLLSTGLSIHT